VLGANLWQEAQKAQLKRECEEEIASKIKEKDSRIQELEEELRRLRRQMQAHVFDLCVVEYACA